MSRPETDRSGTAHQGHRAWSPWHPVLKERGERQRRRNAARQTQRRLPKRCLTEQHTSSLWMPDRTRRSSCMWPPTPRRKPRWMQSVRMYVPVCVCVSGGEKRPGRQCCDEGWSVACASTPADGRDACRLPRLPLLLRLFFRNAPASHLTQKTPRWRSLSNSSSFCS